MNYCLSLDKPMKDVTYSLLRDFDGFCANAVIPWSSPIPSFGDLSVAKVATVGLNPSNREFVNEDGGELDGDVRRFHTLHSLGISCWSEVEAHHIEQLVDLCRRYFSVNPYDGWFKQLDFLISGAGYSYYGEEARACHLDIVPCATSLKWGELKKSQRDRLTELSSGALASLLRDSNIGVLVLNGASVVKSFEQISRITLTAENVPGWSLPRKTGDVKGISYIGEMTRLAGVELGRKLLVLGYNHNIQSSFGVTSEVKRRIRSWISSSIG